MAEKWLTNMVKIQCFWSNRTYVDLNYDKEVLELLTYKKSVRKEFAIYDPPSWILKL